MAPGTRSKFGTSMFEPEVYRKQMYCIEEITCVIVGTFRRPGNCASLAPTRYAPDRNSTIMSKANITKTDSRESLLYNAKEGFSLTCLETIDCEC